MHRRAVALVLVLLLTSSSLFAETRFVRGGNDGWRSAYAVVQRNGIEYRTDELGPRVNAAIWAELSAEDRKALIKAYGWEIGRRIDDFGKTTSDQMGAWFDDQAGWTAAADALKAKHAGKAFPALTPVFGPGATLTIPDYVCGHPEVVKSAEYQEAARLAIEVQYDFVQGQALYNILTNAKWDQVCVSVKAISEDLIDIIVDNFMTGAITNGAEKTSELVAEALDPVKDKLKDWLLNQKSASAPEKTAPEIIAEIEKMIGAIESEANAAAARLASKQERLATLAAALRTRCGERTQAKKDAATAVRDAMIARTQSVPGATAPPSFVPRNPEGTPAEQQADIGDQARQWLQTNVAGPMVTLQQQKDAAVGAVVGKYGPLVAVRGFAYPGGGYIAESSDGFSRPYFEVMDKLSDVDRWAGTDIPKAKNDALVVANKLVDAPADVNAVLDAELPLINALDARNRGMDAYTAQIGWRPTEMYRFDGLRNYGDLVSIAASPDIKVEDLTTEIRDQAEVAGMVAAQLPGGANKRRQWMAKAAAEHEDLRFNWENSISWVIAAARQLDRLHAGPYFKRDEYPFVCYGAACVYKYSVDIEGINAAIAAKTTVEARERARVAAVRELIRLRSEESRLLQKLEMSQRSHVADRLELDNFFKSVYARYLYPADMPSDFAANGFPLRTEGDLYNAIVPDITYYGSGTSWIRNRSNLQTNLGQAIERVSGKIPEYYELLNLYQSMDVERSKYLAMSLTDFNAFMTSTTTKIGSGGTYPTAFQIAGVYGVEWPCWQLLMKTQWRQEELNAAYRGYPPPAPVAWDVDGMVTTTGGTAYVNGASVMRVAAPEGSASGIGVPDVDVVLTGYLTASTRTDSTGHFRFSWIGSGTFTASAASPSYYIEQPDNTVNVVSSNVSTNFLATETPASGYFVAGRVTDGSGNGLQGITVSLSTTGGELSQITAADGSFSFGGVAAGAIQLRPVSSAYVFTPADRTMTMAGSMSGLDFSGAPGTPAQFGLTVAVTGNGTVSSVPSGIACPPACSQSFAQNTIVDLTATPAADSKFLGWHGPCGGTSTCRITIDDLRSVGAEFDSAAAADNVPPTITLFSAPASSGSTIAISMAATDNVGVTGYLVTASSSQPLPGDGRWSAAPPSTLTVTGSGTFTLYAWARDAAGNLGVSSPAIVQVTQTAFSGAAPAIVAASATSSTSVSISWSDVTGASSYLVERQGIGEASRVIASVGTTWFVDTAAAPNTAYLYRVKASGGGRTSPSSVSDIAITVIFEDNPLLAGTVVKASHLAQLRTAVNAIRQLLGLGTLNFTDSAAAGAMVRAIHIEELRSALDQTRGLLGLTTGGWTDGSLSGGTIKAVHFQELRNRMP